ncbi:hypothetical protein AVEN_159131-1 [Araneus ventricosus]|uniref:Uncharacterized protein n=1 Tax=Araneus ventricosus TaxID=182803 RepID=A0A4Y2LAC7_ARAVE|nr:hypothetical protein AVEN_159131-1 [Araneus ventricosus]
MPKLNCHNSVFQAELDAILEACIRACHFQPTLHNLVRQTLLKSKVLGFGAGGFQARNPIPLKIRRVWDLLHAKSCIVVKRPPVGLVQKIPTLARPTQKGCKAGRGPVGRPPPACGGRDLLGGSFDSRVSALVSSSSSDRGSKFRGPSQNSPRVASKRDVNITKLNLSAI